MISLLKRRPRTIGTALLGVLITALFWFTPPLRVQANALLAQLFAQTPSDVLTVPVPIGPTPTLDIAAFNQYQTIRPVDEVATLVGFTVRVPAHTPVGCVFEGAHYDPDLPHEATLTYQCEATNKALTLVQHTKDAHYTEVMPVGASAQVQNVRIGATQGEYVSGRWNRTSDGKIVWANDRNSFLVRWQIGPVEYAINATGFPLNELILIAASIK